MRQEVVRDQQLTNEMTAYKRRACELRAYNNGIYVDKAYACFNKG